MNINKFYRKHKIVSTLLLIIVVSFIILLVAIQMTKVITSHGKEYLTPNFVGMTPQEAKKYLEDSTLYFDLKIIDSVFIPDKTKGMILNQDPSPNSKIKKNRKIYLTTVAFTAPKVEMPNLLDLSLRQAENMLESNNLKLGQVIYKESKYTNAVLEQRYKGRIIEAGQSIPYMSKITLIVGKQVEEMPLTEEIE